MELGCVALVQSRLDSGAGVRQAAVAVVLVRLDPADVEVADGAIVTVLHQKGDISLLSEPHASLVVYSNAFYMPIPEVCSSGSYTKWVCSQVLALGPRTCLASGHLSAADEHMLMLFRASTGKMWLKLVSLSFWNPLHSPLRNPAGHPEGPVRCRRFPDTT